jgi:hypothetical protein
MTERRIKPDDAKAALLRAANYLKWWRDGGITVDTKAPDDINDVIQTLERLVVEMTPDESLPPNPPTR